MTPPEILTAAEAVERDDTGLTAALVEDGAQIKSVTVKQVRGPAPD